jgi:hypothetical protein
LNFRTIFIRVKIELDPHTRSVSEKDIEEVNGLMWLPDGMWMADPWGGWRTLRAFMRHTGVTGIKQSGNPCSGKTQGLSVQSTISFSS